ncbi:histidine phosphatase family protein [Candidatus Enterococcus murrayae]|uniref:Histidine phosphatase family protein n=1 Tax=Candidatus Enterococcus murrayae TaxID=2815321 RepID=A0ABS3HFE7_9ENTE|nr:histidine phosphatase family protein [Enterococcus sp. MJM16]MBO0452158.1 histidine phosphatase family protein [Enterococcus sp. MJM16]
MRIYLIRHGETEYNRRRLFYGKSDISLNETGIEQANWLAEKFKEGKIDAVIYTSSLRRTIETAKLIFPNQPIISLEDLDEKDFGLWEGMSADQINTEYPVEWEKWLLSPFEYTPKNAEKFSVFQNRVLSCFNDLLQKKEDFVLVGHLGVLRTILKTYFSELNFWEIDLEQGNYTVMESENSRFKIIKWNS